MAETVSERAARRRNTAAVREYLDYLNAPKRRGRPQTPEFIKSQLEKVEAALAAVDSDSLKKMELVQRKIDLEARLNEVEEPVSVEDLEQRFVAALPDYIERKGITYAALRQMGVPPRLLKEAGLKQTRNRS